MLALVILVSACTANERADVSDVEPVDATNAPAIDDFTATATDTATQSSTATTTLPGFEDGPLAEVCPTVIGIQTAGLPGVAVGPLHLLLGETGSIDEAGQLVSGPLVRPDGTVEDVTLELRSGGPAVQFRSPATLLEADETLMLAQVSTASAALLSGSASLTGVVTLTDASRQAVIFDPSTYPDVRDFDGLRRASVEVRHVTDSPVIAYLTGNSSLDEAQVVPGFDGEPAAFVAANGQIAQLGDLLVDPALLRSLPQWSQAVRSVSARSGGWMSHDDMLVARTEDLEVIDECLGRLVPIIQAAIAAYTGDPASTNIAMSAARELANPLTRITSVLMDEGVQTGLDEGVFGNGPNDAVGDFDLETLESFLAEFAALADASPVSADVVVTNEFIDPSIGL